MKIVIVARTVAIVCLFYSVSCYILPHFDNVRQVYSQLNELRGMHAIVADSDAALFSGDISYLLKLCEYKPPEKPSQVFDVKGPNEEVNRDALLKKYGKHFTTNFQSLEDLPGPSSCVSCEKLVSKSTSSSITNNCGKLKNKAWSDLKSYLNSNERVINRGEHRVPDDLLGLTVCKSCSSKLNSN